MADYKESAITGTKWQRCRTVTIVNAYNETPEIFFHEEEMVVTNGPSYLHSDVGCCSSVFDPQNGVIPLINPDTGQSLGTTCTHAELRTILHSLYLQVATARDAA